MTPAIDTAKKHQLDYHIHEYTHNSSAVSYGLEAAHKLGVASVQVYKTLVVMAETGLLAVAVLPVDKTLNFKKMAKAIRHKKVQLADPKQVVRSTGYVLGGVSPLGQKKQLVTIIDSAALKQTSIYVSAGRRGLEIELSALQLAETLNARFEDIVDG
ncbi:Cys-tRNA(Pro) deacylase [Psychrobacter sp. DM4]|uniref:Cys-tRNA(Pro) deacylase n=1 Tax=Psychrobacter sp. DM4 TaxID=3440637 RepID=UPI003F50933E